MVVAGTRNSTTQGVRKAVRLLSCFTETNVRTLAVGDLSAMTGWTKSSVSRLLAALHEGGLVKKDPVTGRYAPGLELVALAGAALASDSIYLAVHPYLEPLASETGETANLSLIDQEQLLTIDEAPSPQAIKLSGWVGARHPLHGSSSGKVLLASLDTGTRDAILEHGLYAITPHTVTQRKKLIDELGRVAKQGYALNVEELAPGLTSAAAPVRDHSGRVIAAISVAGPSFRLTKRHLEKCVSLVRKTSDEASRKLGFRNLVA